MEFKSPAHVYECIPSELGIRAAYEANQAAIAKAKEEGSEPPAEIKPVLIGLRVLTVPDLDRHQQALKVLYSDKTPDKAAAEVHEKQLELIKSKFAYVKNLVVDGREIIDFDDFYNRAPPELVTWVNSVIYSTEALTEAERKN